MSAIGSVLKKVIKELPENFASKAESVAPMLLKKGVKAEELKFSELAIPKTGKVTKQSLVDAESKRVDKFYTTANTDKYRSTSVDANKYKNPTYREKILKFKRADGGEIDVPKPTLTDEETRILRSFVSDEIGTDEEIDAGYEVLSRYGINAETDDIFGSAVDLLNNKAKPSRYTSTHFQGEPNYLMHTRVYDDNLDGVSTRVVSEIQSDLHQAGRQSGYDKANTVEALKEINQALDNNASIEELNILADKHGLPSNVDIEEWALSETGKVTVPTSPFEKTWLKKGIEREIVDAINDGKTQLAIPISGNVNELSRAAGVQKWYETQVVNTAKKLAKQSGGTFEMKTVGNKPVGVLSGGYKPDLEGLTGYVKNLTNEIDEEGASAEFIRDMIIEEGVPREAASNISMFLHEGYEDEALKALGDELNIVTTDLKELIKNLDNALDTASFDINDAANQIEHKFGISTIEAHNVAGLIDDRELDAAKGVLEDLISNKSTNAIDYAVIKLNPEAKGFSLYSSPIAGAFVAHQAYQAGMSTEEINKKLADDYGYDEEDLAEINTRAEIIAQAKEAGMSDEEIKQKMKGREISADTEYDEPPKLEQLGDAYKLDTLPPSDGKQKSMRDLNNLDEEMTAEDLVSSMRIIHPTMVSNLTSVRAYFGYKEPLQRYEKARDSSRSRIINLAKENYGRDLVWQGNGVGFESWYIQTPEGLVELNQGIWEDIKKNSGEIVGGIGGAIAGAKLAGLATPPVLPIVGPLAKPIMSMIGGAVGGLLGTVIGTQADYLQEAIRLQEDIELEVMAYKTLSASEMSVVGEVIGYPIAKGFGLGWRGIIGAKNAISGGETKAAYKALKDSTFLNDSQIEAIVAQLEKHSKLKGNKYQKGIQAVALTEPGMQDLVRAAGATKPKVSSATAYTVSKRADEVLAQTANLTDEQVPRLLVKDLQNYVSDVKDQYRVVKAEATQSPRGLNFGWDYEDLAVYPVLEDLMAKITDPATKEKFILQMQRVGTMSESRTYGDLIELRQITNDFLYNKRVTKADDMRTLRKVIGNIDEAIEDGAQYVFDDPAKWLEDWSKVRMDYSKMKQVEKTTMYRTMFNRDGSMRPVQPKQVVKALGKYITSIDGSFEDIMSKLPIEGRKMYEGAVVDLLANQFTAGVEKGAKAIHFPMLADELKKINFTTPDARATKRALIDLGETFKNDVYLNSVANQISVPKFAQGLSDNLLTKARYETSSSIYNYIKSKFPGESNRQLALIRATSKLLEKPLDTKNFKVLQEELFDDANLSKQVLELQQLAASNRMKEVEVGTPKIKIYKGGKLIGTGTSKDIPMHRIATLKQAKEIAETEAITLDNKALDSILRQYGYEAVLQGSDRVRILGGK